jgi:hypothetical protein
MSKTTFAALTGSVVLAVILMFVLVLPATAQPWSGHMWDGNQGDPITLDEARQKVTEYLEDIGQSDLTAGEVMEFDNHFYVAVMSQRTDEGAFEVLIGLDGRTVHPEPGPNMMWNTEYSLMNGNSGMMGKMHCSMQQDGSMGEMHRGMGSGMMGSMNGSMMGSGGCAGGMGYQPDATAELDELLTDETVVDHVQTWLDEDRPGLTASGPIAFPGYFTLHTERDGEIVGMLSVQSDTGVVWEHAWHGEFVAIDHGDHQ